MQNQYLTSTLRISPPKSPSIPGPGVPRTPLTSLSILRLTLSTGTCKTVSFRLFSDFLGRGGREAWEPFSRLFSDFGPKGPNDFYKWSTVSQPMSLNGCLGPRKESLERDWQKRLATGWRRVGKGFSGFPCTLQFRNSRGARLETWVCDSMDQDYGHRLSGLPGANARSQRFSYAISQIATLPPVVAPNRSSKSQIAARYAAFWLYRISSLNPLFSLGACAMTTKFPDNEIRTVKIVLSWRFQKKPTFWDNFRFCPQCDPPPSKTRKFNFLVVLLSPIPPPVRSRPGKPNQKRPKTTNS